MVRKSIEFSVLLAHRKPRNEAFENGQKSGQITDAKVVPNDKSMVALLSGLSRRLCNLMSKAL
jgi:hypothetical protein